ncbi:hypothetical protein B0J13DRAFT_223969 [Dactylonectria estremocensis]|uniref:Uncharacterized protein n=1 Tax=Dactylonectria estremocensis TaxID=1079267 RepID=A0A9P9JEN7_9HYPO|nr:hypothetical protein B0J13DRAFT_223969 [Dactylonectria estremocensis]
MLLQWDDLVRSRLPIRHDEPLWYRDSNATVKIVCSSFFCSAWDFTMIFSRSCLAAMAAVAATWGVQAAPHPASTMAQDKQKRSEISTTRAYRIFRPRMMRRDEEGDQEPAWLSIDSTADSEARGIAYARDSYVLVRVESDEATPSTEEPIASDIETNEPGLLSYSWALAEPQDFGSDGVCSIVSKVDGVVVDTLQFNSNPVGGYHDREVDVALHSSQPVFSMEFFCSGGKFSRVDLLLADASLTAVPVSQDL